MKKKPKTKWIRRPLTWIQINRQIGLLHSRVGAILNLLPADHLPEFRSSLIVMRQLLEQLGNQAAVQAHMDEMAHRRVKKKGKHR